MIFVVYSLVLVICFILIVRVLLIEFPIWPIEEQWHDLQLVSVQGTRVWVQELGLGCRTSLADCDEITGENGWHWGNQ